jgi:hypothetical protein
MNTENMNTLSDTLIGSEQQQDELLRKINTLPKQTITIMKYIAALATKLKAQPDLEEHITPLLTLLTNLINIKRNPVITMLKPKYQLLLSSYIFYIDELLNDHLDMHRYTEKHEMLVYFNNLVKECIKTGNYRELYDLVV